MGTNNNVVSVKRSDFEVFEALAFDSESTGLTKSGKLWSKTRNHDHADVPHVQLVILNTVTFKKTTKKVSSFWKKKNI